MSRLNVLLLFSISLSVLPAPGLAQMTKAEYEEHLVKVDAVKEHCNKLAQSINLEKLSVSYNLGKQIEIAKQQILDMLNTIGVLEIQIRSKETLTNDIKLEETMEDESQSLAALAFDFGDSEIANTAMRQSVDFVNVIPPLRKHIWNYANRLEANAHSKH